jgi:FixJ family two-component response regulator
LYLVGEVDAQVDITLLRIDYADEVDHRIVPMIVAGYTDREIADVLHFSHQAVRNRISRILMRSGIRNRTQLASTFLLGRLEVFLHGQPEDETQP